ncbi:peptidase S8 [Microvenator marinus]|uniref:Peptidase S8 n=1 Tax=Microvenator marinus TaxID=2600177 RepID=A0A5B8XRS9_9DELT|nr:S8 family serine peptidase [Microvenator marinus]QED26316.1 peptidase S8 [Microvenator marinus]
MTKIQRTLGLSLGIGTLLLASHAHAVTPVDRFQECIGTSQTTTDNAIPHNPAHATFGVQISDTEPRWDEVILDFDDDVSHEEAVAFAKSWGLDADLNSPTSDAPNIYVAKVEEGAVPFIRDCLSSNSILEGVEENIEYQTFGAPNDPLYQFQWNFKQVNAESAWKMATGKGVVVAVIDTGVAAEDDKAKNIIAAKDLADTAFVKGYDFVDKDDFAWDGHGHGTHVAGTIAQSTNNKYGVAGLAYNSKIMPLRVLNSRGFGQVADIADSIRFAADNGAKVINMSLGGPLPSLVMKASIEHAHKKGVTIIAAAGNAGKRSPSYPAAYDKVVAVAATQFDQHTTFYSQWGPYVDVAAPGGNTRIDQNKDGRPDGVMQETLKDGNTAVHDFALYMGTSMASPHVAAIAALIIEQGVTHPDKVEKILKQSADESQKKRYSNPKEFEERYGAGIVQADAAVKAAVTEQGSTRFGAGLLLALLAFAGVRRKDMLGIAPKASPLFFTGLVAASSGLFFLPLIAGDLSWTAWFSRPLAELDMMLLGVGFHQTPIFASALLPLGAAAFLNGSKTLRALSAGLAIGMAGFLLAESFILTSDVLWIPGAGMLDRVWLAANGLFAFAIGYLTLKR